MLEQFGLSNYENKVYLSLLKLGIADAKTISTASEVPYGRVYDTLDTLHAKSIINEIPGRPKQYTVVEPDLAIDTLMKNKQEELRKLEKQAEVTAQHLNERYEGKPQDQLVWKVAIGDELYSTYFDLLGEAKKEFFGYMGVKHNIASEFEYLDNYQSVLKKLHKKSVNIKMLFGLEDISIINDIVEQAPQVMDMLNIGEIRYTNTSHLGFSIIDSKKVILKVVNPLQEEELLAGVYLWQESLASKLKSSFIEMWEKAKPLTLTIGTKN